MIHHTHSLRAAAVLALAEMHYGADASGCPIKSMPDLIRERAYQLFEARGRQQRHELDDWLQAEREIKHHLGSPEVTNK